MPASSSGSAALSNTVREDSKLKCWNTMPISRRAARRLAGGSAIKSVPATATRPCVGRLSKLMQRTSELLPAPLRPMMPNTSPG